MAAERMTCPERRLGARRGTRRAPSRVAAQDVASNALAGDDGIETLHEGYGLTDGAIDDAVRWWGRVRDYEDGSAEEHAVAV